jgi:hypothetical protein
MRAARIRLSCPSRGPACHGTLTLRQNGGRVGAASYRLARGRSASVGLRLHGARRGAAVATAAEHDARDRPRTTTTRLRLVRG